MKNTISHELEAREHPSAYFAYSQIDDSPGHKTVSTEVETPDGVVGYETEENGRRLIDGQRVRSTEQLEKLIRSPKARIELLKSEQEENRRRTVLLKDFPSAFLFQFAELEPDGVVRLDFHPNPDFRPVSQEDVVLRGVAGTLWIDPQCQRLVKVEGSVTREVTLGWGVVVRLYPGGHFVMKQAEVGPGLWRTTLLAVDLDGKMLLVKNLKVRMRQMRENFSQLGSSITIPEAVAMLSAAPQ